MTNPYHDENGRFCSKEEMKAIVDQLGKAVANQKAGRGKALSNGERDHETFDRWVEMKGAYEHAANPGSSDAINLFHKNIAALKPDAKLQAAVVAASNFSDTASSLWAQGQLAKAYGDDPKAARGAEKQLRQSQQTMARKNFLADVQETLDEHAELDYRSWKLFEQSLNQWERGRAQGLPTVDLHFTYDSKRHPDMAYTVAANMSAGRVTVTAESATTRPVPKATQASIELAQRVLQGQARQWMDERKYIQRADLKELYAD